MWFIKNLFGGEQKKSKGVRRGELVEVLVEPHTNVETYSHFNVIYYNSMFEETNFLQVPLRKSERPHFDDYEARFLPDTVVYVDPVMREHRYNKVVMFKEEHLFWEYPRNLYVRDKVSKETEERCIVIQTLLQHHPPSLLPDVLECIIEYI